MNKKILKVLALGLALALVLSLAACGGSSSSSAPAASSAPASSSAPADSGAASEPAVTGGRPEGYPEKDIVYINAFSAGSGHDVYARLLFEKVREMEGWEHSVVVEYAEGASGDVGWTKFAESEPDGYHLGFFPTSALINAVASNRPYDMSGVTNIMGMMLDPGVIGVAASSPYETLEDLCNAAKENPGRISLGVTGVTVSEGLAVKQLQQAAGCEFNIIPFDGESAVLTAVSGGHCDAFCLNVSDGKTFVDEGSIKYLATGAEERSEFYPEIPTYQESGYDVVQANCRSISAPAGTDPAIIAYLSDCLVAAANDPEVVAKAEEMQLPILTMDYETCREMFEATEQSYRDLWATNPWQ